MKQVVSLIGLSANTIQWMDSPVAEAAVATGVARWPTQREIEKGVIEAGGEVVEIEDRVELPIARVDGETVLRGDWPAKAILTPKMLYSRFVTVHPKAATVSIELGRRKAQYRMAAERDGETMIDLLEVLDEAEAAEPEEEESGEQADSETDGKADAVEVPQDWHKLHWKKKMALAAEIAGRPVDNTEEAMKIISGHVAGE